MTVKVLLFSEARRRIGLRELDVAIASGDAVVSDLLLDPSLEKLLPLSPSLGFAVNEKFVDRATRLRDGDVVAVLPPVSGG